MSCNLQEMGCHEFLEIPMADGVNKQVCAMLTLLATPYSRDNCKKMFGALLQALRGPADFILNAGRFDVNSLYLLVFSSVLVAWEGCREALGDVWGHAMITHAPTHPACPAWMCPMAQMWGFCKDIARNSLPHHRTSIPVTSHLRKIADVQVISKHLVPHTDSEYPHGTQTLSCASRNRRHSAHACLACLFLCCRPGCTTCCRPTALGVVWL